ncbi:MULTISPECIES: phospholipase D-like domain-containing protein [unclassified Acidovorax]|uniref:phospholipase D-like domain-containing protein n=1 Tax=unclassified Acidovorax TaxID=2684926 RepID=UPI000BC595A1|nr:MULTISPECIES: phospholipase D-like domain-containing protein [unclassified Acidovorax]HQS21320.1 phospholipase D-like domain-containing protein [Acidovorax defluvii]OYY28003.1 MAG: cardiolipin synthase B [Acidovorax sp. 35-64-16]OYY86889.1 MAG: cardiolipin synthase B [Acidovorax sp. 28-64-14]OYZ46083.1 MAG: cardiolipin synthase B [Acidovorax sp. 16-64-162]OYZ71473.1 MAG: cardiolipin synthase B [Acidovorax sp. 24-64-9]
MLTVVLTALATGALVLLALNFTAGEKKVQQQLPRLYSTASPDFERALGSLLGPGIVGGNGVTELLNGDQIFPPMLAAIQGAKKSITFETYIYWSGDIGKQFADALSERARTGVRVHVLLDWVGSAKMDESYLTEMKEAGVQIEKFHKPHWYNLARLNNRTHRKLLVVDGQVGFTGGVGIAPHWMGNAQDPDHWRDSHYLVRGPVVAQMQATFLDNWLKVTGKVLHGELYFPPIAPAGAQKAQMFSSSPSSGSESMQLMYHLAITAAERSIDLSVAYFVPDELTQKHLMDALARGVRVRFITPGEHTDTDTVKAASRATWGPLLQAGALIYEYQPTMYHCKVMIVDQLLVSVGSTNFDNRSFRLNDEANLNVYDAAFAKRQTEVFEDDLKRSRRVTYEEWLNRPLREKAHEKLTGWLRSQL